jgi:hypothetical protein
MIIIYHNAKSVLRIEGGDNNSFSKKRCYWDGTFNLAQKFLMKSWFGVMLSGNLNKSCNRANFFIRKKMMVLSLTLFSNLINDGLGYVDIMVHAYN